MLEVRAIRTPHQDEPRIGQCRWGGWATRARRAVCQRHQCFLSNEKPVLPAWARNRSEWADGNPRPASAFVQRSLTLLELRYAISLVCNHDVGGRVGSCDRASPRENGSWGKGSARR